MKKLVSTNQLCFMLFISIFSLKIMSLPSLVYAFAKSDGFFSLLFMLLADFLTIFFIVYIIKKYPNKNFYQFLTEKVGVFFAKVICLFFYIFFILKFIILFEGSYVFSKEAVFKAANIWLYLAIYFVAVNSLFLFGLNSFSRTVEFFAPFIIFFLTICVTMSFFTTKLFALRPFFENGAGAVFNGMYQYLFGTGDYLFMLLFMGNIKFDKKFNIKIAFSAISAMLFMSLIYYSFFASFKYTGFIHYSALYNILQFSPLTSSFSNPDWIPVMIFMFLTIFQSGIYLFSFQRSLEFCFHTKKYKNKFNKWLLLLSNIVLIIVTFVVLPNFDTALKYTRDYLKFLPMIALFVLILIYFFTFKREGEYEKSF